MRLCKKHGLKMVQVPKDKAHTQFYWKCPECHRISAARWREQNREKSRASTRKYYKENAAHCNQKSKEWIRRVHGETSYTTVFNKESMKTRKKSYVQWDLEEDEYLWDNQELSRMEIAKTLGRSYRSVCHRLRRLRLRNDTKTGLPLKK